MREWLAEANGAILLERLSQLVTRLDRHTNEHRTAMLVVFGGTLFAFEEKHGEIPSLVTGQRKLLVELLKQNVKNTRGHAAWGTLPIELMQLYVEAVGSSGAKAAYVNQLLREMADAIRNEIR